MTKAPLKIGDPATVLLYIVGFGQKAHEKRVRIKLPEGIASRRLAREGYSWIRGHHTAGSAELQALLAAEALERDT